MPRGTGETTRQMQHASQGAIYVWCNWQLRYPKELAHKLGRDDLKFISADDALSRYGERLRGMNCEIVVDHAVETHKKEYWPGMEMVFILNSRWNLRSKSDVK